MVRWSLIFPFVFHWRGQSNHTSVTVTTNGVIWVDVVPSNTGKSSGVPVVLGGRYRMERRIAVAQDNLDPSIAGSIFVATTVGDDELFVVSWDGVPHKHSSARNGLNFQATLFRYGRVELRWGEGSLPPGEKIAAGIEDDEAGVAVPASGETFEDGGVTAPGTWPTNRCQAIVPDGKGRYKTQVHRRKTNVGEITGENTNIFIVFAQK